MTEAWKQDAGKPRIDLVPHELVQGAADVLTFGAGKYGPRNWERGMDWGRVFGALQRHLWAFWSGEDRDPETGLPHTHHAACCIAFLMAYEARGIGADDRPKRPGANTPHEGISVANHIASRDAARAEALADMARADAAAGWRPCDCKDYDDWLCRCPTAPHSAATEGHEAHVLGMGGAVDANAWAGRISGGSDNG